MVVLGEEELGEGEGQGEGQQDRNLGRERGPKGTPVKLVPPQRLGRVVESRT